MNENRGKTMKLDKEQLKERLTEILTEPLTTNKICKLCGYTPKYRVAMLDRLRELVDDGFLSLYEKVRGPKSTHRYWSIDKVGSIETVELNTAVQCKKCGGIFVFEHMEVGFGTVKKCPICISAVAKTDSQLIMLSAFIKENLMKKFAKNGIELDQKRFYIEGVNLDSKCPNCGICIVKDLGVEYLSYPSTGYNEITFYCDGDDGCGEEWTEKYNLQVSMEKITD